MKHLYFVRHGESEANASGVYQNSEVGLSKLGKKQAELLAKKFKTIPIDVVLASPFKRTKQTAEIINAVLDREIIYSDLLPELKNPSAIVGKPYLDEEAQKIKIQIEENFEDIKWHHSDEENLYDLMQRGCSVTNMIVHRPEDRILIVSHAGFMKMVIAVMIFGEDLTPRIYRKFNAAFDVNNSAITYCVRDSGRFEIETWNDYLHLGTIQSMKHQPT